MGLLGSGVKLANKDWSSESREGDIYVNVPKAFRPYLSNPPAGRKCPSSLEAKIPLNDDPELAELDLMMPGRLCSTFLVFSVSSDYLKARPWCQKCRA